jgi:PKD repeat protein
VLPEPCAPVHDVDFSWSPLTPTVGQLVTFTGEATGTLPITYTWDFGDGSVPLAPWPLVTHTYGLPGAYTVVLTATNPCGEEVVRRNITVVEVMLHRIYLPLVLR